MDHTNKQQQGNQYLTKIGVALLLFFWLLGTTLFAENMTSSSYEIENPTLILEGGSASSASFKYFSSTGEFTLGEAASASFTNRPGFLAYPTASSPVVSATAGDGQVSLSWTAATGVLATISSYSVGISTTSGSNFTYSSVGNATTSIQTSLTNGTTYYFKVRSYAAGILLSESAQVSATPVTSSGGGAGGGGGGGGGGSSGEEESTGNAGVVFSGRAYPLSKVFILKDGQLAVSTIAGPNSNFNVTLSGLVGGNYTFAVYGQDVQGVKSGLFSFPVFLTAGATTNIGGIYIVPTISVDKSQVKQGDNIAIFGRSVPASEITISVNSAQEYFVKKQTDAQGIYLAQFDTTPLEMGQHHTKSKSAIAGEISPFGKTVAFAVGNETILAGPVTTVAPKGDSNNDGKVNLLDFSVAAFWYNKPNPPKAIDLNSDGKVNLIDFSIMAFNWTG